MSYNFHRPKWFTKKGLVIASTIGAGADEAAKYICDVLQHWGLNHVAKLTVRCASLEYQPNKKTLQRIWKVAEQFYQEISLGRLHKPKLKRIFYFNLWRIMATLGKEDNSRDYRYWQATKMSDLTFAAGVPLNIMKKNFGNLVHWLFKKIMGLMVKKSNIEI